MCGEQRILVIDGGHDEGSPPRVRGTEIASEQVRDTSRITPACAGNSRQRENGDLVS